jgi:hypothetical protein
LLNGFGRQTVPWSEKLTGFVLPGGFSLPVLVGVQLRRVRILRAIELRAYRRQPFGTPTLMRFQKPMKIISPRTHE